MIGFEYFISALDSSSENDLARTRNLREREVDAAAKDVAETPSTESEESQFQSSPVESDANPEEAFSLDSVFRPSGTTCELSPIEEEDSTVGQMSGESLSRSE